MCGRFTLFAIAGLWEPWVSIDGSIIHSCTAITTVPNELIKPIHNRMPVILKRENEAAWLDPENEDTELLNNLLIPFDEKQMETYIVSSAVNSPKNNEKSLIIEVC